MATTEAAAPKTEPVRNLTPEQLRDQKDASEESSTTT